MYTYTYLYIYIYVCDMITAGYFEQHIPTTKTAKAVKRHFDLLFSHVSVEKFENSLLHRPCTTEPS